MPSSRPSGTSPGAAGHFWAGRSSDTTGLAPSWQRAPASPHSAAGTPTSQAQQHFAQGSQRVAEAGTAAGSSGVNEVEMLRQQVAKLQATVAAQQVTIQQLKVWGLLQPGPAGLPVAYVQGGLLSHYLIKLKPTQLQFW